MGARDPISGTATATAAHETAPPVPRFHAAQCLLGTLLALARGGTAARVDVAGGGTVWLDPCAARFAAEIPRVAPFFAAQQAQVTPGVTAPTDAPRRPLEELLWDAAWHGSHGALLQECQPFDVVELRHWPNFPRIAHGPHSARIAALLGHAPITVALAYRLLRVPAEEMFRFYSAATASGLVRVVSAGGQAPAAPATPTVARATGVWKALLDRLLGL